MVIKVVGKKPAKIYTIVCNDTTCRNIIEFDFDDVSYVNISSMGKIAATVHGISCPDCRQVLAFEKATAIEVNNEQT